MPIIIINKVEAAAWLWQKRMTEDWFETTTWMISSDENDII